MSGLFDSLFGSSPKVSQQPNVNTTSGPQQNALNYALSLLQSGGMPAGVPAASPLTSTSLAGLENVASGVAGTPAGAGSASTVPTATSAFSKALTQGAPLIDPSVSSAAFQKGVVQPMTEDFTNYVIPAITGRYGASSGAASSSDALAARQQAGTNLARTLSQIGTQYTLGAEEANQNATLTNQSNLAKLLSLAPSIGGLDSSIAGGTSSVLESLLTSGENATSTPFTQGLNLLQLLLQGGTSPTITQGNTVVNPGQSGLLSSFLGSTGGSNLAASGLSSLLALLP